jgi:hypothetical protein
VASQAAARLTIADLHAVLGSADIEGRPEVLAALERHYHTYVSNVDPAPERALRSPRLA